MSRTRKTIELDIRTANSMDDEWCSCSSGAIVAGQTDMRGNLMNCWA